MIYNVLPLRDRICTACLTFSAPEAFTLSVYPNWDGTMEYSMDQKEWNTWDGSEISGTKLFVRGIGNTQVTGSSKPDERWVLTGSNIVCTGNIETLLDYETVSLGEHPEMANYCYSSMFYSCTALTTAPELPATTLADYCYSRMFYGCTALTTAPELPATSLADYCYYEMFSACTSLTVAPELPATALADYCYSGMFQGCTKLKLSATQTDEYTQAYRIPSFNTGTTASGAMSSMFANTGGTFTGTPEINTTYYLHKDCRIVGGEDEGYGMPDAD